MGNFDITKYDNDLNRLITITKCISDLYLRMNEESKDELEEYISFCSKIENEIYYDKLDVSNNKNIDQILYRFKYLLSQTDYSDSLKNDIEDRVSIYCHFILNCQPFTSDKKNPGKRHQKDINTLNMQVNMDYYKNIIYYLTNYLNNSKNKKERKIIFKTINDIKFEHKMIESLKCVETKTEGRTKCITFKHNENLVDDVYEQFCAEVVVDCISICLSYTDKDFKNISRKTRFNISLISMKSALSLFEPQELVNLITYYKNNVLQLSDDEESKKSIAAMTDMITEFAKDNIKAKPKTKQKI